MIWYHCPCIAAITGMKLFLKSFRCGILIGNIFLELPSNMVQPKDSEIYKPVLMESYTSPGGFLQNFNVPIELNSFENVFKKYYWWLNQIPLSMYQGLHILHYTSSGTFSLFWGFAVLIIHQSKGNCELQIQTFREFSAQTSYSQKWSQKILLTALMFSVPSLKQKANSVYEEKKMQLI